MVCFVLRHNLTFKECENVRKTRIGTTARIAVATGVVLASASCGLFGGDNNDSSTATSKPGIPVITCTENARQVDLYSKDGELTDTFFFPLAKNQETLANCDERVPIAATRYFFSGDFGLMTVRQKNVNGRWSTGAIKATKPGKKAEFIDLSGGSLSYSQSAGVFSADGKKILFYEAPFEEATTQEFEGEFPDPTIAASVMSINTDKIGSKDAKLIREGDKVFVYDTDENEQPTEAPATVNSLIYRQPNSNQLEGTSDPDKVYLPASQYDAKKYPAFGFWAKDDEAVIRGDVRGPDGNAESIPLAKQGDSYDGIDPVVPIDTERFIGYGQSGSLYDVTVDPSVGMKLNKFDLKSMLNLGEEGYIVEPVPGTDVRSFVFIAQQQNGKRGLYIATITDFGSQPKLVKIAGLPTVKKDASIPVAVMAVS